MFKKDYIPQLYKIMSKRKYTDTSSPNYVWLWEWEWNPEDDVMNYQYEEGESMEILPFAFSGRGDKWVFVNNGTKEPYIGLCELVEYEGIYYAKNLEDAIMKCIMEYVSSGWWSKEAELREQLKTWKKVFGDIFKSEYVEILNQFEHMPMKKCKNERSKWDALLTHEECDKMIEKYLGFALMEKRFPWCS